MRFSLKWALAAMAYVALAAAALSQLESWIYGDLLWVVAFFAFGYAILVASFASASRRATAVGFAVLASCYLISLAVAPERLPTGRLLAAAGSTQQQPAYSYPTPVLTPQPTMALQTPCPHPSHVVA